MPPVLRAIGVTGEGVPELMDALERHFTYLEKSGKLRERRRARLRERVVDAVEQRVRAQLWRDADTTQWLEGQLPALERGETTPLTVAKALLVRSVEAGTLTGQDKSR
jgi:LAO/AO transport system kinase